MLQRTFPAGFIAPCLPTKADTLPSGGLWIHEIKHDGFRIIARKDGERSDGTSTLRATGRSSSATPANSI
jgi:ATP-dependent DNA ligase